MILTTLMIYLYISIGFMAYDSVTNMKIFEKETDFLEEMVGIINEGLKWPLTVYKFVSNKCNGLNKYFRKKKKDEIVIPRIII